MTYKAKMEMKNVSVVSKACDLEAAVAPRLRVLTIFSVFFNDFQWFSMIFNGLGRGEVDRSGEESGVLLDGGDGDASGGQGDGALAAEGDHEDDAQRAHGEEGAALDRASSSDLERARIGDGLHRHGVSMVPGGAEQDAVQKQGALHVRHLAMGLLSLRSLALRR